MFHKFAILFFIVALQNPSFAVEEARIRKDIEFLASDEMKGRLTGTAEARKAAEYIASEFQKAGLQVPPDQESAFQSFEFTSGVHLGSNNSLRAINKSYELKKDFIPVGFSEDATLENVAVVFAGFGIRASEFKYDSYEGLDVKGKIVLCYRFGPQGDDPKSRYSRFYPIRYKAMIARDMGAAALLVFSENEKEDDLLQLRRDSSFGTAGIPVLSIKREVATDWMKTAGKRLPDRNNPHDDLSFDLPGLRASLTSTLVREKSKSDNVLGWLPAQNSTKETLVIGAHYDHLGMGIEGSLSSKSNVIHNGADDNASGVAGLLEMARDFGSKKRGLQRNMLFIAFGGEELGVLGSSYFVKNPVIPLQNIVAMLNMDMIGRLRNQKLLVGGTGTSPAWRRLLDQLNEHHLKLTFSEDGYGPSDHSMFYSKDIPVLFFFTGAHGEYHKPEDDADRIEYRGMVAVLSYVSRISERILAMPSRPAFARVKSKSQGVSTGGFRVYLGTIPDYSEEVKGVKLTGVQEGSPAQKAGLLAGDVIVEFNGRKIENVYDYTYSLQQHKAGDTVPVVVLRDGKSVEVRVVLGSRSGSE